MKKVHIAKMNMIQVLNSPVTYISILLVAAVFLLSIEKEIDEYSSVSGLIELFIGLSLPKKLVVLIASIPYVTSFCSDWNYQYIKNIVIRSNSKRYILAKVVTCYFTAFVVSMTGLVLGAIILNLAFPEFETIDGVLTVYAPFGEVAYSALPSLYYILRLTVFSLSMALWSLFGLCVSAFVPNGFVAITATIVSSYIIEEFTTQLPDWLNLYKITNSTLVMGGAVETFIYYLIVYFIYAFVISYIFYNQVLRRIRNEVV